MPLSIRRVLTESVSIAVVLLAWGLLSAVAYGASVQLGIQVAGLVMAGLYAIVRGVSLAADASPAYVDSDVANVLRENGRAMLAGLPWFALAFALEFLVRSVLHLEIVRSGPALVRTVFPTLVQAFAFTGALTVLLVAVATGTPAIRSARTL